MTVEIRHDGAGGIHSKTAIPRVLSLLRDSLDIIYEYQFAKILAVLFLKRTVGSLPTSPPRYVCSEQLHANFTYNVTVTNIGDEETPSTSTPSTALMVRVLRSVE